MARYQLNSRISAVLLALLLLGFGSIPFLLGVVPLLTGSAQSSELSGRIFFSSIFAIPSIWLAVRTLHGICTILVDPDGTIHLLRIVGARTTLKASDIWELEGGYDRDYDGHYTIWKFSIRSSVGNFKLGKFPGLMVFIDSLLAMNSRIVIVGQWPLGSRFNPLPPPMYS